MNKYHLFKKMLLIIEAIAVLVCFYCWLMNDFESNVYEVSIRFTVLCVIVNLCYYILAKVYKKATE